MQDNNEQECRGLSSKLLFFGKKTFWKWFFPNETLAGETLLGKFRGGGGEWGLGVWGTLMPVSRPVFHCPKNHVSDELGIFISRMVNFYEGKNLTQPSPPPPTVVIFQKNAQPNFFKQKICFPQPIQLLAVQQVIG